MTEVRNKTARHVAQQFQNSWLCRHPRPSRCVHDNGGEFIGCQFQELLEKASVADKPTTSRDPQANAICERMHQTVLTSLGRCGTGMTSLQTRSQSHH